MRLDFDNKTPLLEQRMRVAAAKKPGRRHHHKPSNKVVQQRKNTAKRRSKLTESRVKKYKNQVAAYFRGVVETYPTKKF